MKVLLQRACHAYMAAEYTNAATGMTRYFKYTIRHADVAEWLGLKQSADLLMGLRSARCSVFKDRCASAPGFDALHAWDSAREPQKDAGV